MASAADAKRPLYLGASRTEITRHGGGDNVKPGAELASLVAAGNFLEFWQAEVKGDHSVNVRDGYIFEKRNILKTPLVEAHAELKNGMWAVTMSRKLKVEEKGRHALQADQNYNIGFALHDDYAEGRIHYVSFGYTLSICITRCNAATGWGREGIKLQAFKNFRMPWNFSRDPSSTFCRLTG